MSIILNKKWIGFENFPERVSVFKEKKRLTRGRTCGIIREVKRLWRFPQPLGEVPKSAKAVP